MRYTGVVCLGVLLAGLVAWPWVLVKRRRCGQLLAGRRQRLSEHLANEGVCG